MCPSSRHRARWHAWSSASRVRSTDGAGLLWSPGMWWRRLRYVLLLTALCAIATYPVARRSCIAKTRAAEADELLGYLVDRVAAHVAATAGLRRDAAPGRNRPAVAAQ